MRSTEAIAPSRVRDGILAALPLALAVGVFGVSFGVLAESAAGMGALAAVVMSMTTFAGSAQFAAASILAAGGGPISAIAAAVMLNLRYLPIGVSVAPYLDGGVLRRFGVAQLVVDESWAIASRGAGRFDARRLIGAGFVLWLAWVGSTLVGVAGGEALGNPADLGLDAAFPALFLALMAPQLVSWRARLAALLGALIALGLYPLTPAGVSIVAAGAAAFIGWSRR